MTTTRKIRIGARMELAIIYVQMHPGCTKYEVSKWVGPHGSTQYGNGTVLRCMNHGLIEDRAPEGSSEYALYVTDAGLDAL
jgi:hypothetical protein